MRIFLSFLFIYAHTALAASVISFAFVCLVFHNMHTLDLFTTIYTWNENIWASCLMHFNIFSQTFCFADCESLTLDWLIITELIMVLYLLVAEHLIAAKLLVFTYELHRLKLFLYVLFYVDKPRLLALHRTLPCFFCEFVKTNLMESTVTFFTFPWVN